MARLLARSGLLLAILVLAIPLSLAAEQTLPRILHLGVRPSADASAGHSESHFDAGMSVSRYRELAPNAEPAQTNPVACADSEVSAGMIVVLEYDGGMRDRIEDLYVLDVPHAANLRLDLTYPTPTADFDLFLMTLDGEGELQVVAASNFHAPGRPESIAIPVWPGRFYVGVSAVEGSSPYALTVSAAGLFASSNEVAVRLLNACGKTNRSWVFAEGSNNSKVTVTVTDTVADTTEEYAEPTEKVDVAMIGQAVVGTASPSSRRRAAQKPGPCSYAVSPATQTITSTASTGTVAVTATAGCVWTSSSSATWLTITDGKSGVGDGTVSYSFLANTSSSSRTATLTAAGKSVAITQSAACTFTASPTSQSFTSAGGTGTVSVTTRSDCAWTASVSTSASWITISAGQSGLGNGTVSYSVAANSSTSSRSGTMTVAGRTVTISQSPDISKCTYTVQYTSKSLTSCGGDRTIGVTTQGDCPWTATSDASWLTIILRSGTGTWDVPYVVDPNTTSSSRQATLTIAGTAVTITQSAFSSAGTYTGNWTGTTNGGRAVKLCIAEGAIQSASISVRLDFPTFYCTTPLIRQDPLPFTGSTFSGTFTTYPEVSNVFTTVRGTFTSSTAVNGSWDPFSQSYFIFCGSTIGFGTGGTILSSGTFNATKQP